MKREFLRAPSASGSEVQWGMLLCGPPCGLFVFLSSSYHRRSSLFPYGDQSNKKIRAANQLVINFLIILSVAESRQLFWMWLGLSNKALCHFRVPPQTPSPNREAPFALRFKFQSAKHIAPPHSYCGQLRIRLNAGIVQRETSSRFNVFSAKPFNLRIEQPGSSTLWLFPELAQFLKLLGASRVHTYMRAFGHMLPKPTVLYANIPPQHLVPVDRKWSPEIEKRWKAELTDGLLADPATAKLWVCKRTLCRTALRFWNKVKSEKRRKVFHFKSSSSGKTWVNGGPDLAESAMYTKRFCTAVIIAWSTARSAARSQPALRFGHRQIWKEMFGDPEDLVWEILQQ